MSAPLIWIIFPGLMAVVLYLVRRWSLAVNLAGLAITLLLAWLAWNLPIGKPVSLGRWPVLPDLLVTDQLVFLGRRFLLTNGLRPVLVLIYLGIGLWFGGARVARTERLFVPLGLALGALLTAALAVEPFLYAALLIEMAALVSVPILAPPGRPVGKGVLRFIVFQTLGMPFILFAGWLMTGLESQPGNPELSLRATLLVGLGFAFFLAVFPLHTWIPILAEEAHPYSAAFVFFVIPGIVSLFALSFLSRYSWLNNSPLVILTLRTMGALMVFIGGLLAIFQRHLGRILGYATLMETGLALLALSLAFGGGPAAETSLGVFFAQLLPRAIGFAVWALALTALRSQAGSLRFRAVQGLARCLPVASASLILAQLTLAGFPLLAAFPIRLTLWAALFQQSQPFTVLVLLGNTGLLAAGIRTLAVLVMDPDAKAWQITENRAQVGLLSLGWVMLFLIGLLPNWFYPSLANIARVFLPGSP